LQRQPFRVPAPRGRAGCPANRCQSPGRTAKTLVTNTAYSLEHDAALLPPRRPAKSLRLRLGDRRWLVAFGAETAGWLVYVAALRPPAVAI
jgi:hypothetical protein